MKLIALVMVLAVSIHGFSQDNSKSVAYSFTIKNEIAFDSLDLTVSVIIKNKSNKNVDIYQYLEEGYLGDRFFNVHIEMQQLQEKEYKNLTLRYYKNPYLSRMEDSLRHYDLLKKQLQPLATDTLTLNLLAIKRSFMPGKYRFKVHLRTRTIEDSSEYHDENFETAPPEDKIEYETSKWIYLTVKRAINKKLVPDIH